MFRRLCRDTLWKGNAGTERSVEHLVFDQDPISTDEHHEMLFFIAVKVHWQAKMMFYCSR